MCMRPKLGGSKTSTVNFSIHCGKLLVVIVITWLNLCVLALGGSRWTKKKRTCNIASLSWTRIPVSGGGLTKFPGHC